MFYQLPPVGNPVCLCAQADISAFSLFSSYKMQFYASGTAALAAAIIASIKQKDNNAPEIILPAYGCPDLISAVVYAGAKPVLVDLEVDRPWLDLSQLSSAITEKTVAIVAVNLFGISERWAQLREVAEQKKLVLIEDSAQYFPASDKPQHIRQDWQGDLVVLSFGRGKPVSLLGGGAVISNRVKLFEQLPGPDISPAGFNQRMMYSLKARLYNAMISPYLYWLPQSLPFLHLGETRYHTLQAIEAMDQKRMDLLPANISCYQDDANASIRREKISLMLDSLTDSPDRSMNLPRLCNIEANRRLLRYPLLLETVLRDVVYQRLKQAGLGVSIMYPASLPKISGVNHLLDDKQSFPNAEDFASRVLTLPTHKGVSDKDIDKMKTILGGLE